MKSNELADAPDATDVGLAIAAASTGPSGAALLLDETEPFAEAAVGES